MSIAQKAEEDTQGASNSSKNQDKVTKNIHSSTSFNTKIDTTEILKEVEKISNSFIKKSAEDILKKLILDIEEVNFREYAEINDEKDKIQKKHYLVSVIEILLDTANKYNFNLCRKGEMIFLFNNEYWESITTETFKDFLGSVALKMGVQKFDAKLHTFKDELYKQFIADAGLKEINNNDNKTLINLSNGTFEIETTKQILRPFNQSDFMTYQLPFNYNEEATAPTFTTFLNKVLPEKELQEILSEYLGYIFIKNNVLKLEKVLLLYGTGANGKSVLFEIMNALLGKENITSFSLQSLTNENGYNRAMLGNKLLNYASEINGKLETNIFKQLISGEPVEARLPYGIPQIISDYAKFMFNCNELPKEVENTNAFFRRFIIIPFRVTIPEEKQDKELAKKIVQNELSGVFNWVLSGLKRLIKNKSFTYSDIAKNEVTQFRKESDSVLMFLEENNYKSSLTERIDRTKLYAAYNSHCIEFGNRPLASAKFYKRLKANNYQESSSNGIRYIYIETV